MRQLKNVSLVAVAVLCFTGILGAGPASATTLEIGGVTQNKSVAISTSAKAGTSVVLRDTFGFSVNSCTTSNLAGSTATFTGAKVSGPVSTLTFSSCTNSVTVHKSGSLELEYESGTTNARVYSTGAEWTVFNPITGTYNLCKTFGTLIGTLTGGPGGTMHMNGTISCGEHMSSAKWTGTYSVTSPAGLGVSA